MIWFNKITLGPLFNSIINSFNGHKKFIDLKIKTKLTNSKNQHNNKNYAKLKKFKHNQQILPKKKKIQSFKKF